MTNRPPSGSLSQLLRTQAEADPGAVAIVAPDREPLTYGRLWSHVARTADTLNAFGLGRSDRIAVVLPNGAEMATAFCAISAVAISAPLNPTYKSNEFDFYLSDLDAKALIVESGSDTAARSVALSRSIPIIELSPAAEAGVFTLEGALEIGAPPSRRGFAEPDEVALVLHTSGTTSKPKLVPLTQTNLYASALNLRKVLALTPGDRCLNIMPLFHIHGLVGVILSSLSAGASVVCSPGFYAPKFFEWVDEFHPTWYSAVPTMHQAILGRVNHHRDVIARRRLRFIRSSSAALPPQVMAELESAFAAPVIEAYGMTEAAHQIASNPLPPRERKPGSVGVAAGPEIAVVDEAGNFLSAGEVGEIVIRGVNVTPGYANNPAANQSAFIRGWFKTGDQGWLDKDGYLFITGRLKELINRGGEKISPREVDEALMAHPDVTQAVSFAIPDVKLGEDVAAAVVLAEKSSATEGEIREFASSRLADFKVPRLVLLVDEIPKGPTGKLQRIGLAEHFGLTAGDAAKSDDADVEFVSPRNAVEEALTQIWCLVLGVEQIGVHDNFLRLGGDSVLAAQIVARVYEATGVELSLVKFFAAPTVAGMSAALEDVLDEEG